MVAIRKKKAPRAKKPKVVQRVMPVTTFENLKDRIRWGEVIRPLTIAYGMGVDSTAVLVELARRYLAGAVECRPDLILFADTGGEKPETYAYEPVIQAWLKQVGFPPIITVRYVHSKGAYKTLEENCLVNETLPSLAFGYKKCSLKWKRQPQDKFTKRWQPAIESWARGLSVIKAIGYDAGPKDSRRSNIKDDEQYHYWYPLRELGWARERCEVEILRAGLPVPMKSACYFCPSVKPEEIVWLCDNHPDLAERIITMESTAAPNNTKIEGLWRTATKTRPGSITKFIQSQHLLPVLNDGGCESCPGY